MSAAEPAWTVQKVTLAPGGTNVRALTAIVVKAGSTQPLEVSSNVPLSKIDQSFAAGDRLIVMGEAEKTDAVVIFDLLKRTKIDWFYCYEPRRVAENLIVGVEYYPAHIAGEPTDVVLLYDLQKSPIENRLGETSGMEIPAPDLAAPVRVGIPIYPESNAISKSYINVVQNASEARHVLGPPYFLLLPSNQLVFLSSEGADMSSYRRRMAVVSLADPTNRPNVRMIDLPKEHLKKTGENPEFTHVTRLQAVSDSTVQLDVPKEIYGVDSLTVDIPK